MPEEMLIFSGIKSRVSTSQKAVSRPQKLNVTGEHFQRQRKSKHQDLNLKDVNQKHCVVELVVLYGGKKIVEKVELIF